MATSKIHQLLLFIERRFHKHLFEQFHVVRKQRHEKCKQNLGEKLL